MQIKNDLIFINGHLGGYKEQMGVLAQKNIKWEMNCELGSG